ncbi:hypothetical protein BsWGS_06609 [Bradybaena similaris]
MTHFSLSLLLQYSYCRDIFQFPCLSNIPVVIIYSSLPLPLQHCHNIFQSSPASPTFLLSQHIPVFPYLSNIPTVREKFHSSPAPRTFPLSQHILVFPCLSNISTVTPYSSLPLPLQHFHCHSIFQSSPAPPTFPLSQHIPISPCLSKILVTTYSSPPLLMT